MKSKSGLKSLNINAKVNEKDTAQQMAGHLGNANCTIQTLEIIQVNKEKNLLLVKGAVPGAPGGEVVVRPAQKS